MARLRIDLKKIKEKFRRATARVLINGTLLFMIVAVIMGTYFVLRISFSPITHQYSERIHRTLLRVASELNSVDGRILLDNYDWPTPDSSGLPVFKLPFDYINVFPGHVDDLKSFSACSYASKINPADRICAGIIKNRAVGSLIFLQGSFESTQPLTSPIHSKSPFSGHHFLVTVSVRDKNTSYLITLDPIQRTSKYKDTSFSPAWSLTGFKNRNNRADEWLRENEIKGRVLKTGNELNRYSFIAQIPVYAYADDVVVESRPWPPLDIQNARLALRFLEPDITDTNRLLLDTKMSETDTIFSFQRMSSYLSVGEQLQLIKKNDLNSSLTVHARADSTTAAQSNLFQTFTNRVSDYLINLSLPTVSTRVSIDVPGGYSIVVSGDASVVFAGWREAAQAIIAFACLLFILLILIIFVLNFLILFPLNRVRRNTLYMKGKFSDAPDFRIPYQIKNKYDEVGVLWQSISDLHTSITTYGRRSLERIEQEGAILRAIGHEISSPLQDLMIRHKAEDDPSTRSVNRISAAVKTLTQMYSGSKKNTEVGPQGAINSLLGNLTQENVSEYLSNATDLEIERVIYNNEDSNLLVYVDADLLEMALTNILNNANDFRTKGTDITISAYADQIYVVIQIANEGPRIQFDPIEMVFEYGVSSRSGNNDGHQGLGLFHAKKYIEGINGELSVVNTDNGVCFQIKLVSAI